jgi:hypothetical protein
MSHHNNNNNCDKTKPSSQSQPSLSLSTTSSRCYPQLFAQFSTHSVLSFIVGLFSSRNANAISVYLTSSILTSEREHPLLNRFSRFFGTTLPIVVSDLATIIYVILFVSLKKIKFKSYLLYYCVIEKYKNDMLQ